MELDPKERHALIRQYIEGPARFRACLAGVPSAALQWRPAPKEWSVHEIVCHCADAEVNAYSRIRYLMAEHEPAIVAYDQDRWALAFDYHRLPLEPALAVVDAVRAATAGLIRDLPQDRWSRAGRHTEAGSYTADDWLKTYGEHLDVHVRQIEDNVKAWNASRR